MGPSPSPVEDFVRLAVRHPLRWLVPAVLVGAGACVYAVVKRDVWEASQSMMVRAEAGTGEAAIGRFRDQTEMKTLQETVQEVAKSRAVLAAALHSVGPAPTSKSDPAAWPTSQDVDDLAESLKIVPPKGAEFGSTEVFYLKLQDASPERAAQLTEAVADQLLGRYRQLRQERAKSMVAELESAVELARGDVNDAVARLKSIETQVGGDLGELRSLDQQASGDGDVRRLVVELESEIRQNEQAQRTQHELLEMLLAAKDDPAKLPAMPNRLLESQPSLKRLKEGLIDAQIRTSQLMGGMSELHPAVKASIHAETEIRTHLRGELADAVQGVEAELAVLADVLTDRRARLDAAHARLDRLASLRAEYSTVNVETQYRLRQLEQAEKRLVEARASQAGGVAASLLTKIGRPDIGTRPVGPGRTLIAAGGMVGGLLFGLGFLLLTAGAPLGRTPAATQPTPPAEVLPLEAGPVERRPADVPATEARPAEAWPVEAWAGAGKPATADQAAHLTRRTPYPSAKPVDRVPT
jgi:uncharacterized protein involved in exopolysaccharide biosynthesis